MALLFGTSSDKTFRGQISFRSLIVFSSRLNMEDLRFFGRVGPTNTIGQFRLRSSWSRAKSVAVTQIRSRLHDETATLYRGTPTETERGAGS